MKNSSTLVNKNSITSIAIGGFDGMHIAHQTLFANLTKNGGIISIESGYANLTPKSNRQEYSDFPIYYYVLDNIKHLTGEEFIQLLKEEFPNIRKIVVGFDFCFGKNRKHCVKDLSQLFDGEVVVINEVSINNIAIHSRVIREYIKTGDMQTANTLLGKKYKISGSQIRGQGLGSKSFVPTINLKVDDFLLPNEGVYATQTILNDKKYESVTFLGHRITTDGSYAIETHIIDKEIINHTQDISIKFFEKIRENKKFDSFEELKNQIDSDIKSVKKFFTKS